MIIDLQKFVASERGHWADLESLLLGSDLDLPGHVDEAIADADIFSLKLLKRIIKIRRQQ